MQVRVVQPNLTRRPQASFAWQPGRSRSVIQKSLWGHRRWRRMEELQVPSQTMRPYPTHARWERRGQKTINPGDTFKSIFHEDNSIVIGTNDPYLDAVAIPLAMGSRKSSLSRTACTKFAPTRPVTTTTAAVSDELVPAAFAQEQKFGNG